MLVVVASAEVVGMEGVLVRVLVALYSLGRCKCWTYSFFVWCPATRRVRALPATRSISSFALTGRHCKSSAKFILIVAVHRMEPFLSKPSVISGVGRSQADDGRL